MSLIESNTRVLCLLIEKIRYISMREIVHNSFEPWNMETTWSSKERNLNSEMHTTKGKERKSWKKILIMQTDY